MDKRLMPILAVAVCVIPFTSQADSTWPIYDTDPDQYCEVDLPSHIKDSCPTLKKGGLIITEKPEYFCDLSKPIWYRIIHHGNTKIPRHYCIYRGMPRPWAR